MKNTSLANQKHLSRLKERSVSIYSFFYSLFQEPFSPEMMTAMIRRAHHQALMKKSSRMSLTVTSHLDVSRESKILLSGGMKTKEAILVWHVWQRIISLSQVSIIFHVNSQLG
jgi:hypothetical protein